MGLKKSITRVEKVFSTTNKKKNKTKQKVEKVLVLCMMAWVGSRPFKSVVRRS